MLSPWISLWRAGYYKNDKARNVQVATVSPDGLPEVRTVVLRGITEDEAAPYFVSDGRSQKCRALRAGSGLELHVWWSGTKEQFRLRGSAEIYAGGEHAWQSRRKELWHAQQDRDKARFIGPPPGTPLAEVDDNDVKEFPKEPPETFVLVRLEPHTIDYLKLASPHYRACYWREGDEWQGQEVIA